MNIKETMSNARLRFD